jgi:diaminopimelate epimerase
MKVDDDGVTMRVWERGIGETLACGTGMVAVAAVALDGKDGRIDVVTRGGTGQVEIEGKNAWLTGPADYVFSGVVDQA